MPDDAQLRMVARLVDETSAPLRQMQHAFDDFKKGADPENTTKHFQGLSGAVKGFGESVTQIAEPALSSFGIRAGLSAAAVTASVIGLTKAVTTYARGVVEMKDSAAIMNMSTGSVQQWDRAMKAVGIEDGVKSMQDFSIELLKIKANVGDVAQDWQNRGLTRLFGQVQNAARLGDTNKALELMYDHLQKLQDVDPAKAEVFAQWWQHQSAAKLLEARRVQQAMPPVDAAQAAKDAEQAGRLNRSMQEFSVSWGRFYDKTMNYLVPGVDHMIKGMTAGFEKMPEYGERFLNSPVGKLLLKLMERPPEPEKTPEGLPKPPPEIDPTTGLDTLGRNQEQRNASANLLPRAIRAGQEAIDKATTGQVKPRTAPSDIVVPVEKLWQGRTNKEELDALLAQGADLTMPGYPVAPSLLPDWYDQLDPNKPGPKASPYEPDENTAIPDISKMLRTPPAEKPKVDTRDYSATGETAPPWWAAPFRSSAPAAPITVPTDAPATGEDVKEGAKQGIVDGLNAYAQSQTMAQGLKLTEPTADVKRTTGDVQRAVEALSSTDSKPGLEQETKSGDAARRLQQSAAEQLINTARPPSEAMKSLVDGGAAQQQKDDTIRQHLLAQPQLMPSIDQITSALANQKVEGSATLKVDIASPAGTKVNVDAEGLFRQTEVSRRRAQQMEKTAFNDGFE